MEYPPTPELNKMIAARDSGEAPAIEDFLQWLLDGQGYTIVRFDSDGENPAIAPNPEQLMRQYFQVDSEAAERERHAVWLYMQSLNEMDDTPEADVTG